MKLRRTMGAEILNAVANDPEVRPWLGGVGEIDLSAPVGNPANIALVTDQGGFFLHCHEPGVYEVHSMFRPQGRGADLVAAMLEAIRFMFTATDCVEIQTRVPAGNRPAAGLARAAGFREVFTREAAWRGVSGDLEAVSYQSLTFDAWRARDTVIAAKGHWFHEELEAAKRAHGSELQTHPDDEAHDRAAGAAVLMAIAGNGRKAVWSYNRWARLAGYVPIELLSETPVVLDVRDAVVQVVGETMEVLSCR